MSTITPEDVDKILSGAAEFERLERVRKIKKIIYDLLAFGAALVMALGVVLAIVCNAGCVYKGAKVTEGTDFALGVNVPTAEGTFQFDLINYLSGFRLGVAENARLEVKYTHTETNEYFGCVTTHTYKSVDAIVEPCESGASTDDAGESAADNSDSNASKVADDPADNDRLDEVEKQAHDCE